PPESDARRRTTESYWPISAAPRAEYRDSGDNLQHVDRRAGRRNSGQRESRKLDRLSESPPSSKPARFLPAARTTGPHCRPPRATASRLQQRRSAAPIARTASSTPKQRL